LVGKCSRVTADWVAPERQDMGKTYMAKGINIQQATEMITSIHHGAQVRVKTQSPIAGTQTKAVMLTIVARPYARSMMRTQVDD
jgi:hypothetical protein